MNTSEDSIESVLRHAPNPAPPPGLRDRIIEGISQPRAADVRREVIPRGEPWWRRWWPALAAGGAVCLGAGLLAVQESQIRNLRGEIQSLKAALQAPQPLAPTAGTPAAEVPQPDGAMELEQLRDTVRALNDQLAALDAMKAENQALRAQEVAQTGLTPEQIAGLEAAREKALRIQCVNNLKQLGLAARIWATDNGDVLPPDLLSMSNEIAAPKILICPKDEGRQPATDWNTFTAANVSYQFLAPSAPETEPTRVMFVCQIHNNVTLCDGSVQQLSPEQSVQRLVNWDGKLYLGAPDAAPRAAVQPAVDPEMMRRYGLMPAPAAEPGEPAITPQP